MARIILVASRQASALWWLIATVSLALIGNTMLGLTAPAIGPAVPMVFMGAYAMLGLFGLDPTANGLARPATSSFTDTLSVGRLAFLGVAVAAIPVTEGGRALVGSPVDPLLLVVGGAGIATLVMVRIGRLSSERERAREALSWEAAHDPLTRLPNRRWFVAHLSRELAANTRCLILFCDLDGFKTVNDRHGHAAGDELLLEVARRLRRCVDGHGVVCRFGGDEFLVLLTGGGLRDAANHRLHIGEALTRPVSWQGQEVQVGASIGIAEADGGDAQALIQRADHSMYEAKRR